MSQFGDWVKTMRKTRRWTQEELAARSGVSQSFISALETGVRKHPGIETLRSIAIAFGLPVEEVIRKVGYARLEKMPPAVREIEGPAAPVQSPASGEAPNIHSC